MQTVNVADQLNHLVVAYLRSRRLRVVTCHPQVLADMYEQFVVRRVIQDRGRFKVELTEMYSVRQRNNCVELIVPSGLIFKLNRICKDRGVPLTVVDVETNTQIANVMRADPLPFRDDPSVLNSLRGWQTDAIALMRHCRFGRVKASTGSGKSALIAFFCYLANQAKILVHTGAIQDITNLHRKIAEMGSEVEMATAKNANHTYARVVCCTTQSLNRVSERKFDIMIGDEIHEHATPKMREQMWLVKSDRVIGLSANQEDRADKADLWIEGFYGPIILERSYEENERSGDVVKIKVRFIQTTCRNPSRSKALAYRELYNVVRNEDRNHEIAKVAEHYAEQGLQVLILVRTTEHCLRIREHLPGAVAVFNKATPARWEELKKMGLVRPGEEPGFNARKMQELERKFAKQEIMLAVANSVWHKGKDFPGLNVVVRADALATPIANTQIAGRSSRVAEGKEHGLIVDCWDAFDTGLHGRAKKRRAFYRKQKWELVDG